MLPEAKNKLKTHNEILEHQAVETLGIQPNHRILEVGFGPGVGLAAALRRVKEGSGKVYGVDISSIVLSLTNQAFATEIKSGKLEIVQADVINLPYGKNFFDGIFHTNCYYFWPDIPLAIRELNRVLKPGVSW
ncbi:predicted protein [Nematostella vectensis]|uniref:Methyltransferase type 11 domain-containing protein n=1 Tax=Nematostella vectensis TaxID=45351 RepID=A7SLP3_NEMVE|nr:predicted protein [Nematostella vectensis]|eukprot:XP_001627499.1 predicted protein [Nematostella vectensis]